MRLRDCPSPEFDWRDLLIYVKHADDTTKLWQSQNPKYAGWTVTDRLLAIIANALRWLVWAKTKDAKRNRNRPKPIPRPGDDRRKPREKGKFAGAISRPLDEVKRLLSLRRR